MELEGSNVFAGRRIERLSDKVGKAADVVGVGVDRGLGEVADQHVLGQPPGQRAGAFLVRRHVASRSEEGALKESPLRLLAQTRSASPFYRNVRYNRTGGRLLVFRISDPKKNAGKTAGAARTLPLKDIATGRVLAGSDPRSTPREDSAPSKDIATTEKTAD